MIDKNLIIGAYFDGVPKALARSSRARTTTSYFGTLYVNSLRLLGWKIKKVRLRACSHPQCWCAVNPESGVGRALRVSFFRLPSTAQNPTRGRDGINSVAHNNSSPFFFICEKLLRLFVATQSPTFVIVHHMGVLGFGLSVYSVYA